jgi:hypothetical protein
MQSDLERNGDMAEEPGGASDASKDAKRGASNATSDLAAEREALWAPARSLLRKPSLRRTSHQVCALR